METPVVSPKLAGELKPLGFLWEFFQEHVKQRLVEFGASDRLQEDPCLGLVLRLNCPDIKLDMSIPCITREADIGSDGPPYVSFRADICCESVWEHVSFDSFYGWRLRSENPLLTHLHRHVSSKAPDGGLSEGAAVHLILVMIDIFFEGLASRFPK